MLISRCQCYLVCFSKKKNKKKQTNEVQRCKCFLFFKTCLNCVNMVKRWLVYYLWWTSACFKNISITFDLRLLIIHSASSNFSKCYQIKEFNSQAPLESHILWFQYCSFFDKVKGQTSKEQWCMMLMIYQNHLWL